MSTVNVPRIWTDDERQRLLDILASGEGYRAAATALARREGDCRDEAEFLREQGWTASGAIRRMRAPPPSRRCLCCRDPFAPRGRFIFRCDACLKAHSAVAA